MIRFLLLLPFLFYIFPLYALDIRVKLPEEKILSARNEVVIKGAGKKEIFYSPSGNLWRKDNGLIYQGRNWGNALEFIPKDKVFQWGKRKYRGLLRIYLRGGKVIPVNYLNVEDFLRGVIKGEISPSWPRETLKAQIVAARSYAVYSLAGKRLFDVTAGTGDMVYGGIYWEDARIDRAVKETEGEILLREGKVVPGYFSACAGGHTEWASWVWESAPKYFVGVSCPFCQDSPYYRWKLRISKSTLSRYLGVEGIKNLKVLSFTPSGRVNEIKVEGSRESKVYKGNTFRKMIGYSRLRSTLFTFKTGLFFITFSGKGWGHGVGLCQWGAKKMGEMGYSYKEILKFYYPFAKVSNYEKK
ncbi:MAG: SpoIID/LytB domain-containing protein [Caldiserica bacterium]|nr:SpoIID/LytB domain-containing protein [Caldisericota bacterium]